MTELGELGFLGSTIPEEYGGAGGSYVAYGLVAREVRVGHAGGVVERTRMLASSGKTGRAGPRRTPSGLLEALDNVLGSEAAKRTRPYPDGPEVLAVDLEAVRREFYDRHHADGKDAKAKAAAKRQAFSRAIKAAQDRKLMGLRSMDIGSIVWKVEQAITIGSGKVDQ